MGTVRRVTHEALTLGEPQYICERLLYRDDISQPTYYQWMQNTLYSLVLHPPAAMTANYANTAVRLEHV